MNREEIIDVLRLHQAELEAAGVAHVRLFGSVVRGNDDAHSDIDLAVDVSTRPFSLFAYGGLQNMMSDWLGSEVHLSPMHWMRPSLQQHVLVEAVDAF